MSKKSLVLDANILIRAVLGRRVLTLIADNAMRVNFFAPDIAWQDARKYFSVFKFITSVSMASSVIVISPPLNDAYISWNNTVFPIQNIRWA
jgi:PIN domain